LTRLVRIAVWITSDGSRVFISYHDAGNSPLIHVQRSDDDGFTWARVGDPVVAQGSNTGNATFNNDQWPIVADSFTHNVYDVYAAGQASIQKGTGANSNNILVSKSTDGGQTWTATLVYHAPLFTALNNVFSQPRGGPDEWQPNTPCGRTRTASSSAVRATRAAPGRRPWR